jgi:hypothetical protein
MAIERKDTLSTQDVAMIQKAEARRSHKRARNLARKAKGGFNGGRF